MPLHGSIVSIFTFICIWSLGFRRQKISDDEISDRSLEEMVRNSIHSYDIGCELVKKPKKETGEIELDENGK